MNLFRFTKQDLSAVALFFLTSVLTVADLFLTPGRSANMDGIVHTMTPNLFYYAIKAGEFPVTWIDGFANYGLPLGVIAHQLTTYLTAILQFVVTDPVVAFNSIAFLGFFLSTLFFYFFLRIYFLPIPAFVASIFFHFAPYRILNIFIRGAIPEFFAGVFVPILLIGLYLLIKKRNAAGALIIAASVFLITLTHPFMLVISAFLALPYMVFLLSTEGLLSKEKFVSKRTVIALSTLGVFAIVGFGMGGYFIIPLMLEIKYFYYGLSSNHLTPNNYLEISHFFDTNWYYFTNVDILSRGFVIQVGLIESLFVIAGILLSFFFLKKRNSDNLSGLLLFSSVTAVLVIVCMLPISDFAYKVFPFLGGIQFPWRLLSVFIFLPPIIAAYLFSKVRSVGILLLFLFIICVVRFPGVYGKNYVVYSDQFYRFTPLNLHATVMNPVWTGRSEDYPIKEDKAAFIEGSGKISVIEQKNALRHYVVDTKDQAKIVDYTFYFPGWMLYVDGQKSTIEYQDPKYRGVITYSIPEGTHDVVLRFEDTRVRLLGKIVSIASFAGFVMLLIFNRRIQKYLA